MVIDKAREEAYQLHLTDLKGIPEAHLAVPTAEPNWDPNEGRRPILVHYSKFISAGLWKGEPKQKSLNKIQEIQQKPNEDPSEFLERIYQTYRHYTDADPEAPENTRL